MVFGEVEHLVSTPLESTFLCFRAISSVDITGCVE